MSPAQITALEQRITDVLKPGTTMLYPGKSLRWAAKKMGLSIDQLETRDAGPMGLPPTTLDARELYALGAKFANKTACQGSVH